MRVRFRYQHDATGVAIGVTFPRPKAECELEALRRRAYWDELTGLPNALALEDELERHKEISPLSVLVLDFDGMRAANSAFGFTDGGDVLIAAVGKGLAALIRPDEFAARMHTAGDEFAVLLPGLGKKAARARAKEIETSLDGLRVPQTHRSVYGGASVGHATRQIGETPGQVLGRAIEVMRDRKLDRRQGKQRRSRRHNPH